MLSGNTDQHRGLIFAPFLSSGLHPNFFNLRLFNMSLRAASRIFSFHAQILLYSIRLIRRLGVAPVSEADSDALQRLVTDIQATPLDRSPCAVEGEGVELTELERELCRVVNDPFLPRLGRAALGLPDPQAVEKRVLDNFNANTGAQALALALNMKLDEADLGDDAQSALEKGGGDPKISRRRKKPSAAAATPSGGEGDEQEMAESEEGEEEGGGKRRRVESAVTTGEAGEEMKSSEQSAKDQALKERRRRQRQRPTVEEVAAMCMGGCDSLVVATDFDPLPLILAALPFLKPGSPFAIFHNLNEVGL